ncbi:response regulator [Archangium violaceum]|uniref:sensor histidine kinase n=1 Tax=Archangium violaceum TaxID=83451 RepID=UPI001951D9CD|nr:response regulator [Archangium violaceum]QRO01538.1 response regulator [Archangium violaceum]
MSNGPDSRRPRPWRVLIVDDDAASRRTASALLSPAGYEVVFAINGEEALAVVGEAHPDLVLLDVMMPGLDGIEVCRRLRERSGKDYVPIILLTALDGRREVVLGLEAGADDFLTKPVHGAELRARVANLLKVRAYHQLLTTQRDSALATVDELRQQILQADRLATLGTFAAGVSHELNNIAQVLNSAVDELPPQPPAPEDADARDTREVLAMATRHVTELARTILRMARPQEEATPLADLGRTLGEVRDMLRLTGRARHVRLSLELPETPCVIQASPVHAQQVFLNLLANAADALSGTAQPEIQVGVRHVPGGHIEAWVQDNGPGMSEEVLARVFEPFFTTKPAGQGTGLGLPVVKQLVESWGGHLHLHSRPGHGTRVVVEARAAPSLATSSSSVSSLPP